MKRLETAGINTAHLRIDGAGSVASVAYERLVPALARMLQEQNHQISQLQQQVADLQRRRPQ